MDFPSSPAASPLKLTLAGRTFSRPTHICAFFDSAAQEDACVGPYVAEGLDNGEQVFAIRNAADCAPYMKRLAAAVGRTFEKQVATGQLRLRATEETYLAATGFEADRMIEMLVHVIDESRAAGYPRVRTCGDMNWAVEALRDVEELMEYEARVNLVVHAHECICMCVYDLNRFGGRAVMEVLATHPMVLMGDRIFDNPYYLNPVDFLQRRPGGGAQRPGLQTH